MEINDACNIKSSVLNKYEKGTVVKTNTDSKNVRYVSVIYAVGYEATKTIMLPETDFIFKDNEYWQK
jgi:hypothetical protein